ncbi:MAG: class I SAM-dependent methyltransferase [bacterium]
MNGLYQKKTIKNRKEKEEIFRRFITNITRFKKRILSFSQNKYTSELTFQKEWANKFRDNKSSVLEYWRKYRYFDEIFKYCKIKDNTRILDVGCGISSVLHFINGERYGIDPLAHQYKKLYEYPEGITIQQGRGERISFPDSFFDIVFCSNVLDHTTDPEKTLEEIYRVLKKKGHFILTVEVFEEKIKRDLAHPHSLKKKEVYSLLEDKFVPIFERESPWIGLRAYVNGSRKSKKNELIMILNKLT